MMYAHAEFFRVVSIGNMTTHPHTHTHTHARTHTGPLVALLGAIIVTMTMFKVCILKYQIALPHTATHCNTLQHTATQCKTLQHIRLHVYVYLCRCLRTHCNTLQHTAAYCNTIQDTATHQIAAQYAVDECCRCV